VSLTLLLPWFPILLGVGVGGRLLGRNRGLALGFLCAMFWTVLIQASAGPTIWREPWSVASIVIGAVAIFVMGGWAGQDIVPTLTALESDSTTTPALITVDAEPRASLDRLGLLLDQFEDWLEEHQHDADPWPEFGEFLRTALHQGCGATHVKPYRLLSEGAELAPLREPDPFAEVRRLSARRGIVGHVVTTGRPYLAGDPCQGELVDALAEEAGTSIAWCFAVTQGTQRLGAVVVGQLDAAPDRQRPLLRIVELLIRRFWISLSESIRGRTAGKVDPVCGLYTRPAFLEAAQYSLRESYHQGEPVAVAVIALEGLRELSDSGRWEVADDLVREVSATLRAKVRMDDRLGRFDGSRFIWLLRRVDSELATLIVRQIMNRLISLYGDELRRPAPVVIRCGLVGSGTEQPDLRTLVSRAMGQSRRARLEKMILAADCTPPSPPLTKGGSGGSRDPTAKAMGHPEAIA